MVSKQELEQAHQQGYREGRAGQHITTPPGPLSALEKARRDGWRTGNHHYLQNRNPACGKCGYLMTQHRMRHGQTQCPERSR